MKENTWQIYEWPNGGRAFLTMRHPSRAILDIELDEFFHKITASLFINKSNESGRMVGIETRDAFDGRLHAMVRGILEDFDPPDRSGNNEANYQNFWMMIQRNLAKTLSTERPYLSNPRFVPDEEMTKEFVFSKVVLYEKRFEIHGIRFETKKIKGGVELTCLSHENRAWHRYFTGVSQEEGDDSMLYRLGGLDLSDSILRELERRNIMPLSRMEEWRKENVALGTPIAPSRDEIDAFKALGTPNPLWWDNEPSIEYFRSRGP